MERNVWYSVVKSKIILWWFNILDIFIAPGSRSVTLATRRYMWKRNLGLKLKFFNIFLYSFLLATYLCRVGTRELPICHLQCCGAGKLLIGSGLLNNWLRLRYIKIIKYNFFNSFYFHFRFDRLSRCSLSPFCRRFLKYFYHHFDNFISILLKLNLLEPVHFNRLRHK